MNTTLTEQFRPHGANRSAGQNIVCAKPLYSRGSADRWRAARQRRFRIRNGRR